MKEQAERPSPDKFATSRLWFALFATAGILAAELIGGIWAGSLSLLSDAGHVFSDLASLALALFAIYLARLPVTEERTYGLHRVEVLVAVVNGLLLLGVAGKILYESYQRLQQPPAIDTPVMIIFASLGLMANLFILIRLKGFRGADINLRSAFFHVFSDFLTSVGVVTAALLIWATGLAIVDPIVGAGIAVVILIGALRVLREASHILLESVPKGIAIHKVAESIRRVAQVESVHYLHIWSICSNILALAAHIIIREGVSSRRDVIASINQMLREKYNIRVTTLQVDEPGDEQPLLREMEH